MSTIKDTEKRCKILKAAADLFSRTHDIKKVSLEAIAAEAGVSPTTIYNNFRDRETLIFEFIKDLMRETLERNRAIVNSDMPFPQKLITIIGNKMAVAEKVNDELIEKMLSQDRKIAPFIDELYEQEIKPLWKKMMADGKKEGYVNPALDEEAIIAYLDIIQAGLKAKPDYFKDFRKNMNLIEQLSQLMFYGFLKKEIDLFRKEEK